MEKNPTHFCLFRISYSLNTTDNKRKYQHRNESLDRNLWIFEGSQHLHPFILSFPFALPIPQAIVDTGKTMKALLKHVETFEPKMVKVAGWAGHSIVCVFFSSSVEMPQLWPSAVHADYLVSVGGSRGLRKITESVINIFPLRRLMVTVISFSCTWDSVGVVPRSVQCYCVMFGSCCVSLLLV